MLGRRIQDLPKNLWFLLNRPVYSLILVATVLAAYSPAGYQATLPAYIAAHLPMDSPPEYIVAGIPYTIGISLGALVAGVVMHQRGWKLLVHVKILIIIQAIVTLLFLFAMAPTCSVNYIFDGTRYSNDTTTVSETCSSRCDCRDAQFDQVCSKDGVVFPSSCLAGCRRAKSVPEEQIMVHDLCLCLPDEVLSSGFCNNACYGSTAGYGVLVFAISLCQSFGSVSLVIICLRCISQKLRSLALGFAVCIILLGAYVPGVAVFRAIQFVACLFHQEDCLGDDICWNYEPSTHRFLYHGAIAVFQIVSMFLYIGAFLVMQAKTKAASKIVSSSVNRVRPEGGVDNQGVDVDEERPPSVDGREAVQPPPHADTIL